MIRNIQLFFLIVSSLFVSCQKKMKEEKFAWGASLSAPKEYPVEIYEGALISDEYIFNFSPIWGVIKSGWGLTGGTIALDISPGDLPDKLKMTWYSIQEKKFYTGNWSIDKEHVREVWGKGSKNVDTKIIEDFDGFLVGLAPNGFVSLWITGPTQFQVATFKARDTVLIKEDTNEEFEFFFREDYRKAVENQVNLFGQELATKLSNNGWPNPEIYKEYNTAYVWKFDANGIPLTDNVYFFYSCFNGDRNIFFNTDSSYSKTPIPQHVYVIWTEGEDEKWIADVKFEYSMIKQIFDQFTQEEELLLEFVVNIQKQDFELFLKSKNKKIKIDSNTRTLVEVG